MGVIFLTSENNALTTQKVCCSQHFGQVLVSHHSSPNGALGRGTAMVC